MAQYEIEMEGAWDLNRQLKSRIAELEKTCKSRSDTIIEYSNKIAELEKERDKYKAYFDSGLEKYIINYKSYPRTKKPNKGM